MTTWLPEISRPFNMRRAGFRRPPKTWTVSTVTVAVYIEELNYALVLSFVSLLIKRVLAEI